MENIETQRLILEKVELTDANFIYELVNSPSWLTYIGDKEIKSLEDAREYIRERLISSYETYGHGLLKISLKPDGTAIGLCGFLKRGYLDHVDLGFALLPSYEGKGYAFEAASGVLDYGKSSLALKKIVAICMETNSRSIQLLTKLGFTEVDTIQPNNDGIEVLLFSN